MRAAIISLTVPLLIIGCGHAKSIETPVEQAAPKPSSGRAGKHEKHEVPVDAKTTPVAESPQDLFEPGAEQEIRNKLAAGGYLEDRNTKSLEGGLRKLQAAKDLPVTGLPDHETIRRLGLDPNKIFRHAQPDW
jgi:hypothetical protein